MSNECVTPFNLFDFFSDVEHSFYVCYDPGDHAGEEVYSFMGNVRWKGDGELEINYTFQEEWSHSHSVCYGVMVLDIEGRKILRYSLHDKYQDCFEPSAISMFATFKGGDPDHITWDKWESIRIPDNRRYDAAEWVKDEWDIELDEEKCGG